MFLIIKPFRYSVAFLAAVLWLSMTAQLFVGCTGLNHAASNAVEEPTKELKAEEVAIIEPTACERTLTDRQVIDIANLAVEVSSGAPSRLEDELDFDVEKLKDCQYMLSGLHKKSTGHFRIRMTSSGEILSFPWCCVPGYEVDVSDLIPIPKQPSPKPY